MWLRDEERVWKSGVLRSDWKGSQLSVEDETGKVRCGCLTVCR